MIVRRKKGKICMFCALTSSGKGVASGIILFGSLVMQRLRPREKNNSELIIEDRLDGKVPHSGGSSCVAPSVSCRGIAERMKQRFERREPLKSRHGVLGTGVGAQLACVRDLCLVAQFSS